MANDQQAQVSSSSVSMITFVEWNIFCDLTAFSKFDFSSSAWYTGKIYDGFIWLLIFYERWQDKNWQFDFNDVRVWIFCFLLNGWTFYNNWFCICMYHSFPGALCALSPQLKGAVAAMKPIIVPVIISDKIGNSTKRVALRFRLIQKMSVGSLWPPGICPHGPLSCVRPLWLMPRWT